MTLRSVNAGDGPRQARLSDLERAARKSLDLRVGRSFTDGEWAQSRARLLEFATLLRNWEQNAKTRSSELGNVA
jgi:hypothetical protein